MAHDSDTDENSGSSSSGAAQSAAPAPSPAPAPPRDPARPKGRALTDFTLDSDTPGASLRLLPAEHKLLKAVATGENCDFTVEMPRPIDEQLKMLRQFAQSDPAVDDDTKKAINESDEAAKEFLARLRDDHPFRVEKARPEKPTDENRIRARFLRFLALGGDKAAPVHEKGIELFGACIEGAFDLEDCRDVVPLFLAFCHFDKPLILRNAQTRTLNLQASLTPGIEADGLKTTGSVFLRDGFKAQGEVRLLRANIGGNLDCQNATFTNPGGDALHCDGATITGDVSLGDGFEAQGEVRLLGATIGGDLTCTRGTFTNPGGKALSCDGATITGGVFLRGGFEAQGEVRLLGANIGGDLYCNGGTFDITQPPKNPKPNTTPTKIAFNLQTARVKGILWLKGATIKGTLDLTSAHAHDLFCHPGAWPQQTAKTSNNKTAFTGTIALDGFTYDRLVGDGKYDAKTRKQWLRRQPLTHRTTDFRPQPYEQLVTVLRAMGHDADARKIAKAKQAQQTWSGYYKALAKWKKAGRSPNADKPSTAQRALAGATAGVGVLRAWLAGSLRWLFIGQITGYGYGKKRLLFMLAALWLAGAWVYGAAATQGFMAPSDPIVFTNETFNARCSSNHLNTWTTCAELPREHTAFEPLIYSADVVLPVLSLGYETTWNPVYQKPSYTDFPDGSAVKLGVFGLATWTLPIWALRTFHWAQIILGWALTLLLVGVFSGMMKKD